MNFDLPPLPEVRNTPEARREDFDVEALWSDMEAEVRGAYERDFQDFMGAWGRFMPRGATPAQIIDQLMKTEEHFAKRNLNATRSFPNLGERPVRAVTDMDLTAAMQKKESVLPKKEFDDPDSGTREQAGLQAAGNSLILRPSILPLFRAMRTMVGADNFGIGFITNHSEGALTRAALEKNDQLRGLAEFVDDSLVLDTGSIFKNADMERVVREDQASFVEKVRDVLEQDPDKVLNYDERRKVLLFQAAMRTHPGYDMIVIDDLPYPKWLRRNVGESTVVGEALEDNEVFMPELQLMAA